MKTKRLNCHHCKISYDMRLADYNSRMKKGGTRFFCSRSCSVRYGNSLRTDRRIPIKKTCPYCKSDFNTMTGSKSPTFCSRSCASAGSVTKYRREKARKVFIENGKKGNIPKIKAKALRNREGWKYEELKVFLKELGIEAIFEHPIKNRIFDLALPEYGMLIEFDGPYHRNKTIIREDQEKEKIAEKKGWEVMRVQVTPSKIIEPESIHKFFRI